MLKQNFVNFYFYIWQLSRNRVVKNSIYNVFSFGIPLLLMLAFTPYLVHHMGTEGFGLWSITTSILGLIGVFEFGLGTALAKFVAEYTTKGDIQGLSATVTTGLFFNLTIGFLLMGPIYLLSSNMASLFPASQISQRQIGVAIRFVSLGFVPLMLRNFALSIPMGYQDYKTPMIVKVIQNALTFFLAFVVISQGGNVLMAVLSTVLLMWAVAVVSLGISYKIILASGARLLFSRFYTNKLMLFMLYTGMTGIGGRIFTWMDRIVVGAVFGLSAVTFYTIAIGVANKLLALSDALTQALMPAASSLSVEEKFSELKQYLRRSTLLIVLINLMLSVILMVISEPLLRLWIGDDYSTQILILLRILVIVYAVISTSAPAYHIANGINMPWINAFGTIIGGVLTIILIPLLGKKTGLDGAAWANAGYWFTLIIIVYVAKKLQLKISFEKS